MAPTDNDSTLRRTYNKFVAEKTTAVTDASKDEECPVCLENYKTEACLQIKDIGDCTHRIGLVCLEKWIKGKARQGVTCPLCRALWVPALSATLQPEVSEARMFPDLRWPRELIGEGSEEIVPADDLSSHHPAILDPDQVLWPRMRFPTRRTAELTENYNRAAQSYNQLTQDIESIRARARATQLSSRERRQEMVDSGIAAPRNLLFLGNRRTRPSSPDFPMLPSSVEIERNRSMSPFRTGSATPAGLHPSRMIGRSAHIARSSENPFMNRKPPNHTNSNASHLESPTAQPSNSREDATTNTARSDASGNNSITIAANDSSPEIPPIPGLGFNIGGEPIRLVRPSLRPVNLHARELECIQRERRLDAREARLDEREVAILARETRMAGYDERRRSQGRIIEGVVGELTDFLESIRDL